MMIILGVVIAVVIILIIGQYTCNSLFWSCWAGSWFMCCSFYCVWLTM